MYRLVTVRCHARTTTVFRQGMAKILVERGETTEAIALMDTVLKNKLNVMNPAWVTMYIAAQSRHLHIHTRRGVHMLLTRAFNSMSVVCRAYTC